MRVYSTSNRSLNSGALLVLLALGTAATPTKAPVHPAKKTHAPPKPMSTPAAVSMPTPMANMPNGMTLNEPAFRRPPPTYKITLGYRTVAPAYGEKILTSNRGRVETELKQVLSPEISLVAGARLTAESAYAGHASRYSSDYLTRNSSEAELRDTYLSVKKGAFLFRAGTQILVWGEAFGNYYADIINPKDLRELGLNDLAIQEIAVPMGLIQYGKKNFGFQLVYIPKPQFNRYPDPQSPYAPNLSLLPAASALPGGTAGYRVEESPDWFKQNEFAGKINFLVGNIDISLLGFSGLDRTAAYSIIPTSPTSIDLSESHSRIQSGGFTLSTEVGGSILRAESVYISGRELNAVGAASLPLVETSQVVSVLGFDFPRQKNWMLGLQLSQDSLLKKYTYLFREQTSYTAAARLFAYEFWGENQFELKTSYEFNGSGIVISPQVNMPMGKALEFRWGGDFLGGNGPESQYRRFKGASRAWINLVGYFNG